MTTNPDFLSLIDIGYFRDEASRLVLIKNLANFDDKKKASIERQINAIGTFREFISDKMLMGQQLEKDMYDAQQAQDAALSETEE